MKHISILMDMWTNTIADIGPEIIRGKNINDNYTRKGDRMVCHVHLRHNSAVLFFNVNGTSTTMIHTCYGNHYYSSLAMMTTVCSFNKMVLRHIQQQCWLTLFPGTVNSINANIPFPPRSPDLNPLNVFLWGYTWRLSFTQVRYQQLKMKEHITWHTHRVKPTSFPQRVL